LLATAPITQSAAPSFAGFEAWAFLLPSSGDFPDPHLRSLRLIDQYRSGNVGTGRNVHRFFGNSTTRQVGLPQVSSWSVHFTFESRIISPLEMGTLVVYPTTWELFRGMSRVSPLTGMLVIVMSFSVIFLPAPMSVAATTTSIRSSVLRRTQAEELNASTNVRTVREHFMADSLYGLTL
jgi:hypothetical protein